VVGNASRPLTGPDSVFTKSRISLYFVNGPQWQGPYQEAAKRIAAQGVSEVGLMLAEDDWEYPLWVLLRKQAPAVVRIEHVAVTNISGVLATGRSRPEAVLSTVDPRQIRRLEAPYEQVWQEGPVRLFILKR
jgi:hypothetical protein